MIAVAGCGNPIRGDDGVGPEVLRRLTARNFPSASVRLIDAGTDGIAAMFAARGCERLIIVDACKTGGAPGAVFEVPGSELEQRHTPALNLHDFRWDHAIYAGRRIFRDAFPTDVKVFLIEAVNLEFCSGLSPAVEAAAAIVTDRIAGLIAAPFVKNS
jgi:hydrogenase maturation protease